MTEVEARELLKKFLPNGKIQKSIFYRGLYVFIVFTDDVYEGDLDPYYSVNPKTGEVRDFSPMVHGNFLEVINAFNEVGV